MSGSARRSDSGKIILKCDACSSEGTTLAAPRVMPKIERSPRQLVFDNCPWCNAPMGAVLEAPEPAGAEEPAA